MSIDMAIVASSLVHWLLAIFSLPIPKSDRLLTMA